MIKSYLLLKLLFSATVIPIQKDKSLKLNQACSRTFSGIFCKFYFVLLFSLFAFWANAGTYYSNSDNFAYGCGNVATKTWALAGGGDFNTAANWIPTGVPSSGDSVVINNMNGTVSLSANATIGALTITVNGNNISSVFDAGSKMFTVSGTTSTTVQSGNSSTVFKMNVGNGGIITMIGDYTASANSVTEIYPINGTGGTTGQFIFRGNVTLGAGSWVNVFNMPAKVIFDATGTQTLYESSGGFDFGNASTEIGLTNSPTVIVTGSTQPVPSTDILLAVLSE